MRASSVTACLLKVPLLCEVFVYFNVLLLVATKNDTIYYVTRSSPQEAFTQVRILHMSTNQAPAQDSCRASGARIYQSGTPPCLDD